MENIIYNDDCFNVFDKIENKIVDLVLVDLPYGQTNCDWDICIDLKTMWESLKKICNDNCQFVFFTTTKFGYKIIESNPSWFRYDLVWEKNKSVGFLNAKQMPLRSHEMIYIFSNPKIACTKLKKTYNPQKTSGKPYKRKVNGEHHKIGVYGILVDTLNENKTGDRHPKSVLKYNQTGKKIHATQKPLELCEWLIKTYSNEGDTVLDFCMGSGTTIVACINTNRKGIGIEKDKEIYEIAKKRINSTDK